MGLKEYIKKVLKEETEEIGDRTSMEKLIIGIINKELFKENLPDNFHSVVVDIYKTEYGDGCKITFLMKKPFSEEEFNFLHDMSMNVRNLIKTFFSKRFKYGVNVGISTVKMYKDTKSYYDNLK